MASVAQPKVRSRKDGSAIPLDEKRAMMEALTSIRRAGADIVITYFAKDAARMLEHGGEA